MPMPSWVEEALQDALQDGETIVASEELEAGKLAVASTSDRGYVLRDRMFRSPEVWSFELQVPAGENGASGPPGTSTEPLPEAARATDAPSDEAPEHPPSSLTNLDRVGPKRAMHLSDAGIEDLATLAQADPEKVQEIASVSHETASSWIEEVDLTRVHGIGPARAKRLREAGIETVPSLTRANAHELSQAVDVPVDTVEAWKRDALAADGALGELARVDGIGEARAGGLLDAGVTSLAALIKAEPDGIADALDVSQDTVERWQRDAVATPGVDTDLLEVSGIGRARARELFRMGLTTRDAFAAADASKVAQGLGVREDTVTDWQRDARQG